MPRVMPRNPGGQRLGRRARLAEQPVPASEPSTTISTHRTAEGRQRGERSDLSGRCGAVRHPVLLIGQNPASLHSQPSGGYTRPMSMKRRASLAVILLASLGAAFLASCATSSGSTLGKVMAKRGRHTAAREAARGAPREQAGSRDRLGPRPCRGLGGRELQGTDPLHRG